MEPILDVRNLSVQYNTRRGQINAVRHVSLQLTKGSTLGLVGESGSGKSTLGFSLIRLVPSPGRIVEGEVTFDGTSLLTQSDDAMRRLRGARISMIFQDPMTSLNPVKRIRDHFIELYKTHEPSVTKDDAIGKSVQLLDSLGIGGDRINDFPHQFSGGMRQRVMIGLALALNPKIVIADEPTTALDVIVEAQIIELLKKLKSEHQLTMILITHNIGIVAEMADTIGVMYAGQLVEVGPTRDIFDDPLHPYTKGLLESAPNITEPERSMKPVPGSPPDLASPPPGCKFHPRCPRVFEPCSLRDPQLLERKRRLVACHLYD